MEPKKITSKNIMEDFVDSRMEELLKNADCCYCEQCRADIRTYALNNLPAKYVRSTSGNVYVRFQSLEPQLQTDITTAILNAIQVVKKILIMKIRIHNTIRSPLFETEGSVFCSNLHGLLPRSAGNARFRVHAGI